MRSVASWGRRAAAAAGAVGGARGAPHARLLQLRAAATTVRGVHSDSRHACAPASAAPRPSPFKKGYYLHEGNAAQIYSNLVHLSAHGRTTRAHELHKLLDRVESERDFEYALDGLALCRTRLVRFNDATAAKLVQAAQRSGCEARAVGVLAEALKFRLFPSPHTYASLAMSFGLQGDLDNVKACHDALVASRVTLHPRAAAGFVKAFVDAGDLDAALQVYADARGAVKPRAAAKLVLGGAPLATTAAQVEQLEAIAASASVNDKTKTAMQGMLADAQTQVAAAAEAAEEAEEEEAAQGEEGEQAEA